MTVILIYNPLHNDISETYYRKELLKVFGLVTFDLEQINQEVENIFKCFKDNPKFIKHMKNKAAQVLSTDPVVGFMMCFSFDEFHIIHRFIQEYLSDSTINTKLLKQLHTSE